MFDYMIQRNAEQRRKEIKKRACPPVNFHQFNYGIMTGNWYLDDSLGDSNGYGHASGNEDGSVGTSGADDQDDCELWFDITQNDYDADGLTWWQEVQVGTDPTSIDGPTTACPLGDIDNDGLPNWYEVIYCTQAVPSITWMAATGSHGTNGDQDSDGLSNLEEYSLREKNTDPLHPDLFVEIDWIVGYKPNDDILIWSRQYYSSISLGQYVGIHLVLELDEELSLGWTNDNDGVVTLSDRNTIERNNHDNTNTNIYCCYVRAIDDNWAIAGQSDAIYGFGAFLASEAIDSYLGGSLIARRLPFLHELGHCIGIGWHDEIDFQTRDGENQCLDTTCFMQWPNIDDGSWENSHHYCADCLDDCIAPDDAWGVVGYDYQSRLWNKYSVDGELDGSYP